MSDIRTDGDVVRIARRMQRLRDELWDLVRAIETSQHPNRDKIVRDLDTNGIPIAAWPEHVVHDGLEHPERWVTGDFGIRARQRRAHILEQPQPHLQAEQPLCDPNRHVLPEKGSSLEEICTAFLDDLL